MVICSCRNIRESQFPNREELVARVLEDDYCCGKCLDEFLPHKKDIDTEPQTVYK
jgi:hypothetical protein